MKKLKHIKEFDEFNPINSSGINEASDYENQIGKLIFDSVGFDVKVVDKLLKLAKSNRKLVKVINQEFDEYVQDSPEVAQMQELFNDSLNESLNEGKSDMPYGLVFHKAQKKYYKQRGHNKLGGEINKDEFDKLLPNYKQKSGTPTYADFYVLKESLNEALNSKLIDSSQDYMDYFSLVKKSIEKRIKNVNSVVVESDDMTGNGSIIIEFGDEQTIEVFIDYENSVDENSDVTISIDHTDSYGSTDELYNKVLKGVDVTNLYKKITQIFDLTIAKINSLDESVRHGEFPFFIADIKNKSIRYGTVESDLGLDAIMYGRPDDNLISYGSERMSVRGMKNLGEKVLELIKKGKSRKEIMDEFDLYESSNNHINESFVVFDPEAQKGIPGDNPMDELLGALKELKVSIRKKGNDIVVQFDKSIKDEVLSVLYANKFSYSDLNEALDKASMRRGDADYIWNNFIVESPLPPEKISAREIALDFMMDTDSKVAPSYVKKIMKEFYGVILKEGNLDESSTRRGDADYIWNNFIAKSPLPPEEISAMDISKIYKYKVSASYIKDIVKEFYDVILKEEEVLESAKSDKLLIAADLIKDAKLLGYLDGKKVSRGEVENSANKIASKYSTIDKKDPSKFSFAMIEFLEELGVSAKLGKDGLIIESVLNEEKEPEKRGKKDVNIMVGRFQPFHTGHLKAAEELHKENGLPVVIVNVKSKSGKNIVFSDETMDKMYSDVVKNSDFIIDKVEINQVAFDTQVFPALRPKYEPVLFGAGEDRVKVYKAQENSFRNKKGNQINMKDEFDIYQTKRHGSGTAVRKSLKSDDQDSFNKSMPKFLHGMYDTFKDELNESGTKFDETVNDIKNDIAIAKESIHKLTVAIEGGYDTEESNEALEKLKKHESQLKEALEIILSGSL